MAMSAAERQRRYRQRKKAARDAARTDVATDGNPVALPPFPEMVRVWLARLHAAALEQGGQVDVLNGLRCIQYLEGRDSASQGGRKAAYDWEATKWEETAADAVTDDPAAAHR